MRKGNELVAFVLQVLDLLALQVENNGWVVDKDEIAEQIWRGLIVSEAMSEPAFKSRSLAD